MRRILSFTRSATFALLAAATLTVLALGWVVAKDLRRSADAAGQLYERFGEGLDIIDDILFETGEVRRILLYALHTTDANRQLDYVDQSRSAEGRVRQLLDSRSPILSTARTRAARESVAAAWTDYLQTRDEVVGLILEGSLTEAVSLDERIGAARFNRVRSAIADLKASFEADAAVQVEAEHARASRATGRLGLIVLSALLLVVVGVVLVNRRASLEVGLRVKTEFLTTMVVAFEAESLTAVPARSRRHVDVARLLAADVDPIAYLRAHHDEIASVDLTDCRKGSKDAVTWGEGDAPIREVLQLLKREGWPIHAYVKYQHRGGDAVVEEVKRCVAYAKQAMAC